MCRKNDALHGCGAQRSSDQGRPKGGRRPVYGRPAIPNRGRAAWAATFHPWSTQRCCAGATETGHVPRAAVAQLTYGWLRVGIGD